MPNLRIPGALAAAFVRGVGRFSDIEIRKSAWTRYPAFFLNDREICHFHSGRELDFRLTRPVLLRFKGALEQDGRLIPRRNRSHWIAFAFHSPSDLEAALDLFGLARDANLQDLRSHPTS